jgi:hypothetical protein
LAIAQQLLLSSSETVGLDGTPGGTGTDNIAYLNLVNCLTISSTLIAQGTVSRCPQRTRSRQDRQAYQL